MYTPGELAASAVIRAEKAERDSWGLMRSPTRGEVDAAREVSGRWRMPPRLTAAQARAMFAPPKELSAVLAECGSHPDSPASQVARHLTDALTFAGLAEDADEHGADEAATLFRQEMGTEVGAAQEGLRALVARLKAVENAMA